MKQILVAVLFTVLVCPSPAWAVNCKTGQPCGNSCISWSDTCHIGGGSAGYSGSPSEPDEITQAIAWTLIGLALVGLGVAIYMGYREKHTSGADEFPDDSQPSPVLTAIDPKCIGSCSTYGRCSVDIIDGTCVALTDADCRDSLECLKESRCVAINGRCSAGQSGPEKCSPEDCRVSGWCTVVGGSCQAGSDADCKQSQECRLAGRCKAIEGKCSK